MGRRSEQKGWKIKFLEAVEKYNGMKSYMTNPREEGERPRQQEVKNYNISVYFNLSPLICTYKYSEGQIKVG